MIKRMGLVAPPGGGRWFNQAETAKVISSPDISDKALTKPDQHSENRVNVNTDRENDTNFGEVLIYDVNDSGVDDKFASSILHITQFKKVGVGNLNIDTEIHKKWRCQSAFDFGYIPSDERLMPQTAETNEWDVHGIVKATGVPNFSKARVPIKSQLNVQAWKDNLKGYWDQQLCQLVEFGFPLDFNRNCDLRCDRGNHKSVLEFPGDMDSPMSFW